MKKIHTRVKRKFNLSRRLKHYAFFHPIQTKHRPKTFKTEQAANAWAEKKGLKKGQYTLKSVKKNKRLQVVMSKGEN